MADHPRSLILIAAPLGAIASYFLLKSLDWPTTQAITAAVTLLCALWWVTEAIPMGATALLPLAIFPLFGVIPASKAAESYGHPLILLLLGGFILSKALERCGGHRRIAMRMIRIFGTAHPRNLILGFMVASAFLSMWISNTATTLMLVPVAIASLGDGASRSLRTALFLGVAYAASVGGVGTPVGTPPNLIFMQVYGEATGDPVSFLEWMRWGVPFVLLGVPVIWLWLTRGLQREDVAPVADCGPITVAEKRVLAVFALTALAWVTRSEPFGGWSELVGLPGANDATVAMLAAVLLFALPDGKGSRLLDWETANQIPWGVLILFGGGIAIAAGFLESGLSDRLGQGLSGMFDVPRVIAILAIALGVSYLTELTSNTATTNLLMPILAGAGIAAGVDPALLMIPAAMSASCAFMLPVATAPNAVVYGSNQIRIQDMARNGAFLNLLLALITTLVVFIFVP